MKAGLRLGALMIGCCAGVPLLVAVLGSLTIGSAWGWAAGAGVLGAAIALLALRIRRRRACRPPIAVHTPEQLP